MWSCSQKLKIKLMSSGNVIGLTVLVNKRLANIIFGKRLQMYFKNFNSSIFFVALSAN